MAGYICIHAAASNSDVMYILKRFRFSEGNKINELYRKCGKMEVIVHASTQQDTHKKNEMKS